MFNPLQNKYTSWYFNIIRNRQNTKPLNEYTEKHHIIPKSLGGSNKKDNIVQLTAREHYICHLLLTKMLTGESKRSMHYAFFSMHRKKDSMQRYKPSSHIYEITRKNIPRVASAETRLRMSISGKKKAPVSNETRARLSESIKGSYTPELRAKRSVSSKNRIVSDETRSKMSKKKLGTKASDETRKKLSAARTGEKHPRAKCWVLVSADDKIYRTLNMRIFCEENSLSYSAFKNKVHSKDTTPIQSGQSKGWCVLSCKKINEIMIQ